MRASLPIVPAQLPALQGYAALSARHTTCIGAESPIRAFVHPSQFVDYNSMFILHVFKDLRLLWARAQLQRSATCWPWWALVYLCLRFGLLCRIWFEQSRHSPPCKRFHGILLISTWTCPDKENETVRICVPKSGKHTGRTQLTDDGLMCFVAFVCCGRPDGFEQKPYTPYDSKFR